MLGQGNDAKEKVKCEKKREQKKEKKKKEQKRKKKTHLLSTPSTFWTQRKAPGAGRSIGGRTSIVLCNEGENEALSSTLLWGRTCTSRLKRILKSEIS